MEFHDAPDPTAAQAADTFRLREVLGGWSIIVNPGTPLECEMFGEDGEPMSLAEAEAALDYLNTRERNPARRGYAGGAK